MGSYFLKSQKILSILQEQHLFQGQGAARLGISRSYFNQLLRRARPLSPRVRARLLKARFLAHLKPDDLWEYVDGKPANL